MASQRYEEGGRVRRHLLGILSLVLLLSSHAGADVTISGTQIRGRGANGVLRCTGVRLENPGTIVSARDSGAGFWLQSDTGQFLRFNTAQEALGTPLTPGTWYAYPNLYRDQDESLRCAIPVFLPDGSFADVASICDHYEILSK